MHDLLVPLKLNNVSMTRFESRPARTGQWEYYFYIDLDGHPFIVDAALPIETLVEQFAGWTREHVPSKALIDGYLDAQRRHSILPIWSLSHYGYPDDIDIFSPHFLERFAAFTHAAPPSRLTPNAASNARDVTAISARSTGRDRVNAW